MRFFAAVLAASFAAGAAEHVVTARGATFQPAEITVRAGDSIVWKNDDVVVHTVKASDGAFSSGEIRPDQSFRWKARRKGRHPYVCTLHKTMRGIVVVR